MFELHPHEYLLGIVLDDGNVKLTLASVRRRLQMKDATAACRAKIDH